MLKIKKRDGKIVDFNKETIIKVFKKAFKSTGNYIDSLSEDLAYEFINEIIVNYVDGVMEVEEMQTEIENFLMKNGYLDVARKYIEYRKSKNIDRDYVKNQEAFINKYKTTSNNADATIDDNSNVNTHNIATINAEIHKPYNIKTSRGMIMRKLRELYPDFDAKQYIRDLENHIIYKHDESLFAGAIASYCCAISMYPFLNNGIKDLGGLSAEPKNLDSFCGIYCNLVHAISGQFAGAVATPEFLMYFDYFARKRWGDEYYKNLYEKDGDFYRYETVKVENPLPFYKNYIEKFVNLFNSKFRFSRTYAEKNFGRVGQNITIAEKIFQKFQQVVYTINQPAGSRGNQAAFVNFSYFDKGFFDAMFGEFVFPDGTKPIWDSLNRLQKLFMKWFNEERTKEILTFPVESFALIYKDNKFEDKENADFVAEMYSEGHSFFTYISPTADSLSSCCRLKNKVQTKEFSFTNGNMGVQTGSKSVITLNLNRITQDAMKEYKLINGTIDKLEFLNDYINKILERVYMYHTAYNSILHDLLKDNLLSAYSAGFINLNKQYLTIGLNGLNEAAEFMGYEISDNDKYAHFCQSLFSNIKEQNLKHKTKTENFNTECVPAESLAAKNYNWDKEDGYWVPENHNLYTSYIYRPSDKSLNIIDKIRMHGSRFIGDYLDGGSAAHLNLEEHLSIAQYKFILDVAAKEGCQYFTFNVPNCKCETCGYITKRKIYICPNCGDINISTYDRIIGYLTKIKNWSTPRQIEGATRVYEKPNL